MIDRAFLEEQLSELPLYAYAFLDPQELIFSDRIRYICKTECPMYGKSWACPPAVGSVEHCKENCLAYDTCLLIGTITETEDIADIEGTLRTRGPHEDVTNQVCALLRAQGADPYILSTEACAVCEQCAYEQGLPCRKPERMHPCVESHGIVLTHTLEKMGLDFQYGGNIITWYSLLFYNQ